MKILFIYPNKDMSTRIPLGIGYLASYLKKDDHQIRVFDTTFIKCGNVQNDDELRASSLQVRNPDFKKYGIVEEQLNVHEELIKAVKSFQPDLIAASVVDPNYSLGLELLRTIKSQFKNIKTLIGGPTVTFAPEEVIAQDSIDIACLGEGEETMRELCHNLENAKGIKNIKNLWVKENGKIFKNELRPLLDVDSILSPDWDIFDQRHILRPLGGKIYRMGIFFATRGCLFRCKYCANYALGEVYNNVSLYRIRKPELLVQELAEYKKKYDLNFIFFIDDLFPLHKEETLDTFCRLYKEHVGLAFSISLHPTLVKEAAVAKLVDAGCRNICVGLESGSPEIRKNVLGRIYKDEDVLRVFSLANRYKIRSSAFNMIGMPYETRANIFETIELNRKAGPTTTTLTFFHPYRGTALRDLCIKEKFFDPQKEKEYENMYRMQSHLQLPQISNVTLRGLFKTFQLYIKLPKILYGLIQIAEGDSLLSKATFNSLKRIFYRITDKVSIWDFTNLNDAAAKESKNASK